MAVVLNVSVDQLSPDGIDTVDELARVTAVVAGSASRAVVLNAHDARCVAMACSLDDGVETILFSCNSDQAVLLQHVENGGKAAYVDDDSMMLADGKLRQRVLLIADVACAVGSCARHDVATALAAAATLYATGLTRERIADGLRSFVSDGSGHPLRTKLYEVGGGQAVYPDSAARIAA